MATNQVEDDCIYQIALIKGKERYVFMYDNAHVDAVLQRMAQYAEDPQLSLTWDDAAALAKRIRNRDTDPKIN